MDCVSMFPIVIATRASNLLCRRLSRCCSRIINPLPETHIFIGISDATVKKGLN